MNAKNEGFDTILFLRGECTETLRSRIRDLETECKKLTIDMKVKEDQIRELEMKVQVCLLSRYNLGQGQIAKPYLEITM